MASPNFFCRENSVGKLSDWVCTTGASFTWTSMAIPMNYFSVLTYLLAATSHTTQGNTFSDLFLGDDRCLHWRAVATWTKIWSTWQMSLMCSFTSSRYLFLINHSLPQSGCKKTEIPVPICHIATSQTRMPNAISQQCLKPYLNITKSYSESQVSTLVVS